MNALILRTTSFVSDRGRKIHIKRKISIAIWEMDIS